MKRHLRKGMIAIGIPLTLALVLLSGCTPWSARTQADDDQTERTINVSGSGEASAQPDIATLELGVQTEAKEAGMAMSQNSEQMQAVIEALKEAGVAEEDIQTQIIQVRPRYEEVQRREPAELLSTRELIGYTATNIVEVRVWDLDALGELLDTAVQAGGNRVEGIRFEVSDPSKLLDRAREAAWNDARHKAEQLVDLADAELGEVLTLNESSRRPVPIVRETIAAQAAAVPIQAGTQTIEASVQVTWLLR
jgi:uncharacterized protein YggE